MLKCKTASERLSLSVMMRISLSIAFVVSLIFVAGAQAPPPEICNVGSGTQYKAASNVSEPPDYAFHWASSADKNGDQWCYDRLIRNDHQSNYLVYYWPITHLSSVYGLPPNEEGHNNFEVPQGPPELKRGPLWYGVSRDRQKDTIVYSPPGENEGETASTVDMRIRDSAGEIVRIRLNLRTTVRPTAAWAYNYRFSNTGDAVVIAWDPLKYKVFVQAAKPALPTWDSTGPLPLSAGQEIQVAFEWKKPRLVIAPIALIDKLGKLIATAVAPTYVPASQ